jgi:undecaprenyl-diphosphatase
MLARRATSRKAPSSAMTDLDVRALLAMYGGANGTFAALMTAVTLVGEGWSALLLLPLLGYARTRRFAGALTIAIVLQAVIVWAMKAAIGRVRPWIALGLPAPVGSPHDFSFPSGHAAGSFCLAAFLALALPAAWPASPRRARLVGGVAFVYAALVASSRVYLGAHFPSDVLFGALLGAGIGAVAGLAYARQDRVEDATESG